MDKSVLMARANAVLPQDLWANEKTLRSPHWLAARRVEQRLIGRLVAPGILLGGAAAWALHGGLLLGAGAGVAASLVAGFLWVAWRRRSAAA